MEIIRENSKIILKSNSEIVEEYDFKDNIDLRKLIELLLNNNLSSAFIFEDRLGDKTAEEENLVTVIKSLVDDYNDKVVEYENFINEEQSSQDLAS